MSASSETKLDNTEEVLLPDKHFISSIVLPDHLFLSTSTIAAIDIESPEPIVDQQLAEQICKNLVTDEIAQQVWLAMEKKVNSHLFKLTASQWKEDNGLLLYQRQCYIPSNLALQQQIVSFCHDSQAAGHLGQWKTGELLQRDYFWPSLQTFIFNYIQGCAKCQQMKVNHQPTVPPLQPIKFTQWDCPFAFVTCDFIIYLSASNGYNTQMVVVDHDSMKEVILCPLHRKNWCYWHSKASPPIHLLKIWPIRHLSHRLRTPVWLSSHARTIEAHRCTMTHEHSLPSSNW